MSSYNEVKAGKASVEITSKDATAPGFNQAQKRLREYGQSMQDVGRRAGMALAAGLAPAAASMRVYTGFIDQMAVVRSVTGGLSSDFASLRERAEMLGSTTSFTASEVAAAMTEIGRAGFSTDQILASIGDTLNTARAGGLSLAETAGIMTDTLRSFNMEASQAGRVGDVLAKTASISSTDVGQIGQAMKYVASTSDLAGQKLESVSAAIAVMANRGIKADMAGTSLSQVFLQLAGTDVQRKLAQMGVAVKDTEGNMRDLVTIMTELGEATKDMGNAQRLSLLKELFNARGIRAAAILSGNTDEWRKITGELERAKGTAKSMAEVMDDTIGGAWREMMSAIEGTQIAFGDALEQPMRNLYGVISDMARAMAEFIKNNQGLISTLTMGAGGLAVFSAGLYGAGAAIKALSYGASGLKMVSEWAGRLAERYRQQLAEITGSATAQQAKNAQTNAAAAAEEKLAASATGATAALKAEAAAIAKTIALLEKLAATSAAAAAAQERLTAAQGRSATAAATASANLAAALTAARELTKVLMAQTAALKANSVAAANQVKSIRALAAAQAKLAAATAKATAATRAQTAATQQQAMASAVAARAGQALAVSNRAVSATATQTAISTNGSTAALTRYSGATALATRAGAGMRTAQMAGTMREVSASVVATSTNMRGLTTNTAGAAKTVEALTSRATAGQKAMAGLRAVLATTEVKLALLAAVGYGIYSFAKSVNQISYGGEDTQATLESIKEIAEKAQESATETTDMAKRMGDLASNSRRSAEEQKELEQILTRINEKYKLIDGSIQNVIGSQEELNGLALQTEKKGLEDQVRELIVLKSRAQVAAAQAKRKRTQAVRDYGDPLAYRDPSEYGLEGAGVDDKAFLHAGRVLYNIGSLVGDVFGAGSRANIKEINDEIKKAEAEAAALQKQIDKVYAAIERKEAAQEAAAKGDLFTGLNEDEFKTAQQRLTAIEDQFRRERQSGLENEIEDIRKLGEEYDKLLRDLADSARYQGKEELAREYEARLESAGDITAARVGEATRKAREATERAIAGDMGEISALIENDERNRRLGQENRLIDSAVTADPGRAAAMLQEYTQQLTETINRLQQEAQDAVRDAYADGEKSQEEDERINGLTGELGRQIGRRAEMEEYLRRAQEAAQEAIGWETRGTFGGAAGALGTGTSSVDERQAKLLESIDKHMIDLKESFKTGMPITVQ